MIEWELEASLELLKEKLPLIWGDLDSIELLGNDCVSKESYGVDSVGRHLYY